MKCCFENERLVQWPRKKDYGPCAKHTWAVPGMTFVSDKLISARVEPRAYASLLNDFQVTDTGAQIAVFRLFAVQFDLQTQVVD